MSQTEAHTNALLLFKLAYIPNLQALPVERKGLAGGVGWGWGACATQSHRNDDEWEINAHTSKTI